MTLEQQIADELGNAMSKAINWEVMTGMLTEMGWTVVQLHRYVDNHHAIDIREWVSINCKSKTDNSGATWIFEDPAEATMFTLRWVQ